MTVVIQTYLVAVVLCFLLQLRVFGWHFVQLVWSPIRFLGQPHLVLEVRMLLDFVFKVS